MQDRRIGRALAGLIGIAMLGGLAWLAPVRAQAIPAELEPMAAGPAG